MEYLITFLEGFISFISPCMLPMLPIYVSYFSGNSDMTKTSKKGKTLSSAIAFVVGFTAVFCALGLFAGTLGAFLTRFRNVVNIVCGIIVIIMGLGFLEIIHLPFFKGTGAAKPVGGILSALVFGAVFSVSLTPCVGAFLGSALMMASVSGTAIKGLLLLFTYSLGLGIPFIVSALLIDRLKNAFSFIKRNYLVINRICGGFLIVVGIMMCLGLMNVLMDILS